MKPLYKYQERVIDFAVEAERGLLAVDAGLGKTRIYLEIMKKLHRAGKVNQVLYMCPAHLIPTALRQKEMWLPEIEDLMSFENGSSIKVRNDIDLRIISYQMLSRVELSQKVLKQLKGFRPELAICDESQKLINWETNTAQRVLSFCMKIKYCVFGTATPYVNGADDYHPILSTIAPGKFESLDKFREKYCYSKPDPFTRKKKWFGTRPENADDLVKRMAPHLIRVKTKEAEAELPKKVNTNIYLELDDFGFDAEEYLPDIAEALETGIVNEELSAYDRALGRMKAPKVLEWILDTYGDNTPILIFAWHVEVVELLSTALRCPCIFGETPMHQRTKIVWDFQGGRIKQPLVLSHGAGKEGLDGLQRANTVIHAELPWSYVDLYQADCRVSRLGQSQDTVFSYRMIAVDSLDEMKMRTLEQKREGAVLTIGGYE